MPAQRGRRDPSLVAGPDGVVDAPSPEELETAGADQPDEMLPEAPMTYDGEIASTAMTLAVVLPGDTHASYFRGSYTGRKQDHEDDDDFAGRVVSNTRNLALGQLDDAVDATQEYFQNLMASGRLGQPDSGA